MNLKLFIGALCLFGATATHAKILYVDGNANANSLNCTKTLPCNDVQDAMDILGNGDTVRISPGYYSSVNGWVIPFDNVKIESVQGARVTELAAEFGPIFTITGNNVKIGGKGKGIGYQSYFEDRNADINLIQVEGVKKITIEGNRFTGNDWERDAISGEYDETEAGIALSNVGAATIKSNYFLWINQGIAALNVTNKTTLSIQGNVFERVQGDCVNIDAPGKSKVTIKLNQIERCREDNESRLGDVFGATLNLSEGVASIVDNAFSFSPINLAVNVAKPSIQRNSFYVGRDAINLQGVQSGTVKDNTIRYFPNGVRTEMSEKVTMTGNHMWVNTAVIHTDQNSSYKTVSGNMFGNRGNPDECAILLESPIDPNFPLIFKSNGWTSNAVFGDDQYPGPDTDSAECIAAGTQNAVATGQIVFVNPKENVTPKLKDKVPF